MDNNQQQDLSYCMWRQKALVVIVLMLVMWWQNLDGRKRRGRGVKYGPLITRDVWRRSELIRLIDTSDRICISQLWMCRALFYKLCSRLRGKGYWGYIEEQKEKPTTFTWKQHHHLQCADALNGRFGNGVTRNQVYRNFRSCKEKWGWIRLALAKSGNGFDATVLKFNIDPSEKDPKKLGTAKYNYLTRPIKFYRLLEELFVNSPQADGSLAIDQSTVNVPSDSDESEGVKELENYQMTEEDGGNDSDTIARNSPTTEGTSSGKKRKRIHPRNPSKGKKSRDNLNDKFSDSIVRLVDILACGNPNALVQNNVKIDEPSDPNALLWKRIKDLTVTARDKIEIASYLSNPNQETFRSYLKTASDTTFQAWVIDFLSTKYGVVDGFSSL